MLSMILTVVGDWGLGIGDWGDWGLGLGAGVIGHVKIGSLVTGECSVLICHAVAVAPERGFDRECSD
jgi:hypothetical protein